MTDDLWTCPRCGARFVTRNLWHGCGNYSIDGFFEGRPPRLRELYDAYVGFLEAIGPFDQVPTKTRIAFMVRVRFLAVNRVRKDGLGCHLWLKRRIDSPRFTKVEQLGRTDWIHHAVIRSEDDLDQELASWIGEAYNVGRQAHVVIGSEAPDVSGTPPVG